MGGELHRGRRKCGGGERRDGSLRARVDFFFVLFWGGLAACLVGT